MILNSLLIKLILFNEYFQYLIVHFHCLPNTLSHLFYLSYKYGSHQVPFNSNSIAHPLAPLSASSCCAPSSESSPASPGRTSDSHTQQYISNHTSHSRGHLPALPYYFPSTPLSEDKLIARV